MASVTRPAGLVKLMTQASGASRGDPPGDVDGDRDRAQPVGDAARADRLLAEDALVQGDPLVGGAALQAADADRGEDEVGAAQRLVEVGGDACTARGVGRPPAACSASTRATAPQPGGVQVVQGDVGDAALGAVRRAAPRTRAAPGIRRRPEWSASHLAPPLHLPRSNSERRSPGPTGAFVTTTSSSSGPQTLAMPGAGELRRVGEQDHLVAGRDHRPFDRHLDDGGVHAPGRRGGRRWCRGRASRRAAGGGCPR